MLFLMACGSSKKLKTDEFKEEKQIEVVETQKFEENETVVEKNTEYKDEVETNFGVVIQADEVAIDSAGNITAKGNVEVAARKTEKKYEAKKEIEKYSGKSFTEEARRKENQISKTERKLAKEKQVDSSGWSLLWYVFLLLIVFLVFKKLRSKFNL